jgi:hypothetical protein
LKKIIHDKLELNFLTKLKTNKTFIKGLRKRKKNQNTKNKEDKVIHLGREERKEEKKGSLATNRPATADMHRTRRKMTRHHF